MRQKTLAILIITIGLVIAIPSFAQTIKYILVNPVFPFRDSSRVVVAKFRDVGRDAVRELFVVDVKTGTEYQLTGFSRGDNHDFCSEISPDGRKVSFIRQSGTNNWPFALYAVDIDGKNLRLLDNNVYVGGRQGPYLYRAEDCPQWSPDSKVILYHEPFSHLPGALSTIESDGSNKKQFINLPYGVDHNYFYNKRGDKIIYGSVGMIFMVDSNGQNRKILTWPERGYVDLHPTLSDDGRYLTFVRLAPYGTGQNDFFIIKDLQTSQEYKIHDRGPAGLGCGGCYPAKWSPDQKKLLYYSGFNLYRVDLNYQNLNASQVTNLTRKYIRLANNYEWLTNDEFVFNGMPDNDIADLYRMKIDCNSPPIKITNTTHRNNYDGNIAGPVVY